MQRDTTIPFDLEATSLEIKTNSVPGRGDRLKVKFYSNGNYAGNFYLYLGGSGTLFGIHYCITDGVVTTNLTPTADHVMVFRITRISGDHPRVIVHCNDVEILNIELSETVCNHSMWKHYWRTAVNRIKFDSGDRASDSFRPSAGINYN